MSTETLRLQGTDSQGNAVSFDVQVTRNDPATSTKPKLGGCGIDNAEFDAFQAAAGPLVSRRTFDSTTVPTSFSASKMGPEATSGRVQIHSYKLNPSTFPTDTVTQNKLIAMWDTVPWSTIVQIIETIYHEPSDNIAAGTFTVAQWCATIGKLGDMVAAYVLAHPQAEGKLKVCVIFEGAWTFDSTSPYSAYDYVGGLPWSKIHYIGLDPYKAKPTEPSMEVQLTQPNYGRGGAPAGWLSPMAKLAPLGKPFLLPEWGCTETSPATQAQKAQWITDAYAWMKAWNVAHPSTPIVHAPYFNTDYFATSGGVPNATWALDSTTTMNAFKAAIADSRI